MQILIIEYLWLCMLTAVVHTGDSSCTKLLLQVVSHLFLRNHVFYIYVFIIYLFIFTATHRELSSSVNTVVRL